MTKTISKMVVAPIKQVKMLLQDTNKSNHGG